MRVHILSDLHLEFDRSDKFPDYTKPDCDVVVLAGDIGLGTDGAEWAVKVMGTTPIIYVTGNHEAYGRRVWSDVFEGLRAIDATYENFHYLNNQSVLIDGVMFHGCPLWTDFALDGDPKRAMIRAVGAMNDYAITLTAEETRLRPEVVLKWHQESRAFLEASLMTDSLTKQVVVTHHLPSRRSIHAAYDSNPYNMFYASNLDELIEAHRPTLWVHGHTHTSNDYVLGHTRIVSNPRGYVYHEPNPTFDPGLVVEI